MAQDIRALFREDKTQEKMPENHQERFLSKLEDALPVKKKSKFIWFQIAASVIILIGLGVGGLKYFQLEQPKNKAVSNKIVPTKTLGDVSPGLKKVENYYLLKNTYDENKKTHKNRSFLDLGENRFLSYPI